MEILKFRRFSRRLNTLYNRVLILHSVENDVVSMKYSATTRFYLSRGFWDTLPICLDVLVGTILGRRYIQLYESHSNRGQLGEIIYYDGSDISAAKLFTISIDYNNSSIDIEPALIHDLTPEKCLAAIEELEDIFSDSLMIYNLEQAQADNAKDEFVDMLIGDKCGI